MSEDILENKDFLRVQKLNDSRNKRQSLHQDELDEKDLSLAQDDVIGIGLKAESEQEQEDPTLKVFVKRLNWKEKYRFHKDSGEMQSMLRDVEFNYRGTIMDNVVNNINEPLKVVLQDSPAGKLKDGDSKTEDTTSESKKGIELHKNQELTIQTNFGRTNFSGFYVLFWFSVAFIVTKVSVDYYIANDGDLGQSEVIQFMTKDLVSVALIDLAMYLSIYFVFAVQYACRLKWISWNKEGWLMTSLYEAAFVIVFLYVAENVMKFHWVAKIFLFLHSLVLLMKMHSFAFYNGYLWNIWEELSYSKGTLAKVKDTKVSSSVIKSLEKSRNFCQFELDCQSEKIPFPSNISVNNFFMYSMFPTVVYQIEYPRTKKIRWSYVFEKLCAIFGIIFIMMVVAQMFMYPVAMRAIALRDSGIPIFWDRIKQWPHLLLDIVPSFIMMYLLVWYLIWDAILNCIAELTCFADRYFYGDWWNCVSWEEFSRLWNVPVHKFLLRHVYHSSISFLQLNKAQATIATFFISSVVHELAMYVLFNKFRLFLFFLQMYQLPLVKMGNSKFFKDRKVLGNVIFWIGICTGPSLMCTLYLTF